MTLKERIQKIEKAVLNFLNRLEHKLPDELTAAATWALNITTKAQALLNSDKAHEIETLVPATLPFANAANTVLGELAQVFTSLKSAFANNPSALATHQKGALFIAAGQLAALQEGSGLPMNRYNLAVQAEYSKHPTSALPQGEGEE